MVGNMNLHLSYLVTTVPFNKLFIILFFLCSISGNGDLVINQVTLEMNGTFKCLASNSEGSRAVTASLQVINSTTIIAGEIAKTYFFQCEFLKDAYFIKLVFRSCSTFFVRFKICCDKNKLKCQSICI